MASEQQQRDHAKWLTWLELIEEYENALTPWERTFVANVRYKFDTYPTVILTPRQAAILERIYTERTP